MSNSAFAPLKEPIYRMLWLTWLTANTCMWMNDIAAAWQMTHLTDSPLLIALVQSASTAPVFLLGIPSGALADILNRRRLFMATQIWVALMALLTTVVLWLDAMTAPLLLLLTFANGMALAVRWPVFSALIPELVSKPNLTAGLALNAVAMNASRILGPLLAGAILAAAGSMYVFVLNTVVSVAAAVVIYRWKAEQKTSALPGERFLGAMRVGVQFVWQSPRLRAVMLRIFLFFIQASALLSLLPVQAKRHHGGDATVFTLLMASIGFGSMLMALQLPKLRPYIDRTAFSKGGILVLSLGTFATASVTSLPMTMLALFVSGAGWISCANSLAVACQMALPNWVRARGMSIYQTMLMGGSALGAAIWGHVATEWGLSAALIGSALFGIAVLLLTWRQSLEGPNDEDLTPALPPKLPELNADIDPKAGPLLITIEYRIDPARTTEFLHVMAETKHRRLRQGALSWELFHDTSEPGRYIEHMIDSNWFEHLRRFERMTASDLELRQRRWAFHIDSTEPKVTRSLAISID